MDRQTASVHIVRFLAKKVEQLCIRHGNQKVKTVIRVAHNEEQGGFSVAQGVQLQLIIGRDLPQLCNIEGGQPCAAAHKDAFSSLASA